MNIISRKTISCRQCDIEYTCVCDIDKSTLDSATNTGICLYCTGEKVRLQSQESGAAVMSENVQKFIAGVPLEEIISGSIGNAWSVINE